MAERADDIAAAFLQHLQRMVKHNNSVEKQASVSSLTMLQNPDSQPARYGMQAHGVREMSAMLDFASH
jgi:hypothetical protein